MMTRFLLLTALVLLVAPSMPRPPAALEAAPMRLALYCTLTGQKVVGQSKACFYNCKGSGYAMSVAATHYCPLGVETNPRR